MQLTLFLTSNNIEYMLHRNIVLLISNILTELDNMLRNVILSNSLEGHLDIVVNTLSLRNFDPVFVLLYFLVWS